MNSRSKELPSASGIVHCLRLLAEEAASLNLHSTASAILEALDTAAWETSGRTDRAEISRPLH